MAQNLLMAANLAGQAVCGILRNGADSAGCQICGITADEA
jgi:hypothetical protein